MTSWKNSTIGHRALETHMAWLMKSQKFGENIEFESLWECLFPKWVVKSLWQRTLVLDDDSHSILNTNHIARD